MKSLRKLFYTAILICIANYIFAQATSSSDDRTSNQKMHLSISFLPLYLYSNATKFDAELQFKGSDHGIILSSEIYNGLTADRSSQLFRIEREAKDKVTGFGLGVAYKHKLNSEGNAGLYLSPGFTFRKMNITAESENFIPYHEDGLLYYSYGNITEDYKLNNLLFSGLIGYQKVWKSGILLDLHIGVGHKVSSKNERLNKIRNYTEYIYSYGFNGPVLLLGFKVGFQIF